MKLSKLKYLIFLAALGTCIAFLIKPNPTSFTFAGKKWAFPATVGEAVQTHNLDYRPPGYYYKIDSTGMEVLLDYHFIGGDFYNENQPKEILFPRQLHSYVFRFDEKNSTYDSLKTNIEQTYGSKFVLTKGIKDGETLREDERPFENYFLTVDPCLTIGIASSPGSKKDDRKIIVRFMYNLSLGKMGVAMSNYL